MGQVPPKYFPPSAPYGSSDATNSLQAVQPMAINPQTPLLPPNFTDPGRTLGATVTKKPTLNSAQTASLKSRQWMNTQ
jgi:hypothetical protein